MAFIALLLRRVPLTCRLVLALSESASLRSSQIQTRVTTSLSYLHPLGWQVW